MTYATDKELLGYVPEYRRIADELGPAARVLEIGVLNGLGLEMWKDMFPDGIVAGVDFSPAARWPEGTIRIVSDQANSELPSILKMHSYAWDLIVDDASHKGHLTDATFKMLWPLVAPGGYYVIEDWFLGLPSWPSTGCWGGAPVGSPPIRDSYDPGLLRVVQDLVALLDEPYRGECASSLPKQPAEAQSVRFQYGLAVVQKAVA